jgi:hypothetical protein
MFDKARESFQASLVQQGRAAACRRGDGKPAVHDPLLCGEALVVAIYERRGGEVLANTSTLGHQDGAEIDYLSDGRFVLVWRDASHSGGDTSGTAIRAQIFNPDGSKSGTEFLVNTVTAGDQLTPGVAALAGGDTGCRQRPRVPIIFPATAQGECATSCARPGHRAWRPPPPPS